MSDDPTRASDAERDATVEHLRGSLAEGRLDLEEYEERLDAAMRARTRGELARLTADLPTPAPDPDVQRRQLAEQRKEVVERRKREWYDEWRSWAGAAVVMIGIWGITSAVSGELNGFWPAIPLGIWALVIIAGVFDRGDKSG